MADCLDESSLLKEFNESANRIRSFVSSLKPEQLLQLYGLYKQATVGKCNTSRPKWYEFEGKQKWDAWNDLGDMSKIEAMSRYINLTEILLENCEDDNSKNTNWVCVSCLPNSDEPLMESDKNIFDFVKEGNLVQVRKMAEKIDINDCLDDEGMGLIHWAADRGNFEMVECLVKLMANVNLIDNSGQTPLHYASSCGHIDVVRFLLNNGADVNVQCEDGFLPYDLTTEDEIKKLLSAVDKK